MKNTTMCRSLFVLSLLATSFLLLAAGVTASESGAAAAARELVQPSGMRTLLLPRPGSGTVLVTVAVDAGSQDEAPSMAGLSHYLEHLLFDGFDELDERGVTEAFEDRAAYVNAFTREQTTVFFALAPSAEARGVAELLLGMLQRSTISEAAFEKEKKVILEELAKDEANPTSVEEELLRSLLWRATPVEHPVGGSAATVGAVGRDDVVSYWRRRYEPASWRVLITGDASVSALAGVAEVFTGASAGTALPSRQDSLAWDGWGQWQAVAAPAPAERPAAGAMPPMAMQHGMGGAAARDATGKLALVVALPDGVDLAAAEILARWLGDAAGPLLPRLVPGLAQSVTAGITPRSPRSWLELRVEASLEADPEVLLATLLAALDDAVAGPDDAAVSRLDGAWRAERVLTGQRLHYAAVFYGEALAAARGPLLEAVEPPAVDPAGIRRVASAVLTGLRSRSRAAWVGDGGPQQRVALPRATVAEIPELPRSSELEDGPMNSRRAVLGNGMEIGILPEQGAPVFGIHLLVADRSLREPAEAPGIADLMHRLLTAGTDISSSTGLSRRLTRAGIEVKTADASAIPFDNRYHVPDFSYVRMEGPAEELEEALTVLAEMLRLPAWDETGWESAVTDHRAAREADNRGGDATRELLYAALLGRDHPLARPVSGPLDKDPPTADEVRAAWGAWPDGTFASDRLLLTVASPVPPERCLEMIEDLFGGGPTRQAARGPYPDPRPAEASEDAVVDATAPQLNLMWGRLVTVDEAWRAPLVLAVNALSDRMVAKIREEEGLAYRLGAGVRAMPWGEWMLSATVGTRPENRDRVEELLGSIVAELAAEAPSAVELKRLIAREQRSTMLRSLSAASRAYRLGRAMFEGPGSPLLVDEQALVEVSPDALSEAVRRYLDPGDLHLVIGD